MSYVLSKFGKFEDEEICLFEEMTIDEKRSVKHASGIFAALAIYGFVFGHYVTKFQLDRLIEP